MKYLKLIPICFGIQWLISCSDTPATQPSAKPPEVVVEKTAALEQLSDKYLPFSAGLNSPMGHSTEIKDGKISMTAGKETDFFIEPGLPPYEKANAPLLLKQVDNTKPFTFSCKTTPVHQVKYDAGMAFIYVNDKNWLKFAFEADERMHKRLVTVKTRDFSDDNNHDAIQSESVFLKISSDTKVVGFYYSTDGNTWQLVRVFKNEYPAQIYVGIGTQSPAGNGNHSEFEQVTFTGESVKDFRMGI
jgi:regulation of enolase protein 1 (concanavalin A-like superfamily)